MFTLHDARWLSETAAALYRAQTIDEFTAAAMGALDGKFSLHSFACEEIGREAFSYRAHRIRCATTPPADHAAYFHDNPLAGAVREERLPPILHMRGAVPFDHWSRTDHYNGIARPMGWHDQLIIVGQARATFVGIGLHRDTVFSPQESALASLLQPHAVPRGSASSRAKRRRPTSLRSRASRSRRSFGRWASGWRKLPCCKAISRAGGGARNCLASC